MGNRTSVATVRLLDRVLYSFSPALTPFLFVVCRSVVEVFVFSFHSLCHRSFAVALMFLMRADFSGLCLNGWLDVGSIAAFFASASALSFPFDFGVS